MNLNSRLFDRVRTRRPVEPVAEPMGIVCNAPGCAKPGAFRAPMGRLHEGRYFCFCLDHVRAYNATYNYFTGMSEDAVAAYQKDDLIGHRPTWTMGANGTGKGFRDEASATARPDPLHRFRARWTRQAPPPSRPPRHGLVAMRALAVLGLDDTANSDGIKARFKALVKRLHPDANGGDRSSEDRLREIIQAYNQLRLAKVV